tara:strand:- start:2657 stop:4045 length:1389 start_codon:yes stop_codon:yes gene_type:complete
MKDNLTFSSFSSDILYEFDKNSSFSGIFSFSIELQHINLLDIYSLLIDQFNFSIFWEENNNNSFIALDKCKQISIDSPNRFKVAKNFNDQTLKNIINLNNHAKYSSISKIFYFFSFSNKSTKELRKNKAPILEGVLPKILITNDGKKTLLRMNLEISSKSSINDYLHEFWSIKNQIISKKNKKEKLDVKKMSIKNFDLCFYDSHKLLSQKISKAINLINNGYIDKLVIASRLIIKIKEKLNLISILKKLKINQPNSCRYVWKRGKRNIIFGASPEKLFSYNQKTLTLEAIAGTAENGNDLAISLKNDKNLREHNFVINYLIESLKFLKIDQFRKEKLKLKKFGNIVHLYTEINADIENICPFVLLDILHPSPAVCGYPKEKALQYIDIIENFDRGNYASPFGWVDFNGNADFRVALRGAKIINQDIEFIAGSGLVSGSVCSKEIAEIKLKFNSIANQIFDTF